MSIEQRLNLERDDRRHESTQARLNGRLKSACCRQCGSTDGMQRVYRETIARMAPYDVNRNRWYRGPDGDEYIFYPCENCNWARVIPNDFVLMTTDEVLTWCTIDPMSPDYAALAAEPQAGDGGTG